MSLIVAAITTAIALPFTACGIGAGGEPLELETLKTDFGYVAVHHLDVQAAITEGDAAKDAAQSVFLLPNITFAIVEEGCKEAFQQTVPGDFVVHTWPFPNGSRRQGPRPRTNVLRHEIGHDLFSRHLVPKTREDQYSTDAPDWLDEMAAIAFEGIDQQINRRQMARIDADRTGLLPLSRLMDMTHPEHGTVVSVPQGRTFAVARPASPDTLPFYSTVFAFHEFLIERTGRRSIVAELASAFRDGEVLDRWIVKRIGRDDIGTVEELNTAFLSWFEQDPRYSPAALAFND